MKTCDETPNVNAHEFHARQVAMDFTVRLSSVGEDIETVMKRAETVHDFLTGKSTRKAAPVKRRR